MKFMSMTSRNTCTCILKTNCRAENRKMTNDEFLISNFVEKNRLMGKQAMVLESGAGTGDWSYIGVVNPKVKVPRGEAAILFIEKFLKENGGANGDAKQRGEVPFTSGFVGFLSYDLGAKWQGIRPSKHICPDAYFVY